MQQTFIGDRGSLDNEFEIKAGIKIRKAMAEDAQSLRNFCFPALGLEDIEKQLKDDIAKMERGELFRLIADANGFAVGSLLLQVNKHNKEVADVLQIVVSPPFRGTPIASKLIDAAADLAKQNKVSMLQTEVPRSDLKVIESYKKLGFVEREYVTLEKSLPVVEEKIKEEKEKGEKGEKGKEEKSKEK